MARIVVPGPRAETERDEATSSGAAAAPTLADVTFDVVRTLGPPGPAYFAWMAALGLVLGAGILAWTSQIWLGLGVTGLRTPQFWALYITAFVFWIGIGHTPAP